MSNKDNLKVPTSTEAREYGRKGGIASGKKRREAKTMKAMLDYLLEKKISSKDGKKATTLEAMMSAVVAKAIKGDVKAAQFVRDTIGEMPTVKQEIVAANLNMQKIFITKEDVKKADKHIEDYING